MENFLANNSKPHQQKAPAAPSGGVTGQFTILSGPDFVAGFVAPEYVVEGIIQRGSLYSLTARTGHGKTALCVDLTFAFAHGRDFAGQEVEQGNVCFLVGENPDDVRARFLVAAEAYGLAVTEAMEFIPHVFSIEEKFEVIQAKAEEVGGFIAVIVDTSAAYFQGDDENSNNQVGNHARGLRHLTSLEGRPAVIVPCHPIKNASKENLLPRGGGAYIAEVDGGLTLWSDDNGKTTQLHWQGKLRGVGFEPLDFELVTKTSDKVKDKKGRLIPSVVALPITEEKANEMSKDARSDEDALLDMMLNWPKGSYAQWCEQLDWMSEKGTPRKSKINRIMESLKSDKLVHRYRGRYKLTEAGRKEAEKAL